MKKTVSILAAVAVVAGASMAFAVNGDSNIQNSKHNIPKYYKNGTTTQICVYCHTPHNARMALPLWNRNDGKAFTSFNLYSSQTMASPVRATGFTSDSMSLFCMSCHDGSPLGGTMVQNEPKQGSTTSQAITATAANFGTNLTKTHPVNFALKTNGQTAKDNKAGQLRSDGTSDLVWDGGNAMGVNLNFPLFKSTGTRGATGNASVECSSCHAVHDDYFNPFLRSTMAGSALCLGCHRK